MWVWIIRVNLTKLVKRWVTFNPQIKKESIEIIKIFFLHWNFVFVVDIVSINH